MAHVSVQLVSETIFKRRTVRPSGPSYSTTLSSRESGDGVEEGVEPVDVEGFAGVEEEWRRSVRVCVVARSRRRCH